MYKGPNNCIAIAEGAAKKKKKKLCLMIYIWVFGSRDFYICTEIKKRFLVITHGPNSW